MTTTSRSSWYKDPVYRSRMVREPRTLLAEMGLELADDVRIIVRDSTSEVRWLVLPERPAVLPAAHLVGAATWATGRMASYIGGSCRRCIDHDLREMTR